jgi:hypothetical protein
VLLVLVVLLVLLVSDLSVGGVVSVRVVSISVVSVGGVRCCCGRQNNCVVQQLARLLSQGKKYIVMYSK